MTDKCSNCEHMKKENAQLRKAVIDNNKQYAEVVNLNLSLRRELEMKPGEDRNLDILQGIWSLLDSTNGSESFINDLVTNSIKSWKANKNRKTTL